MNNKALFHIYLLFLLFSLVGNAAADFAFLWLGANLISEGALGIKLVTGFYIGQSVGHIFVAPYLGAFAKFFSKRVTGVVVDSVYVLVYLLLLILFEYHLLNFSLMFVLSVIMAGLTSVHRNGVTFSLLNQLSEKIEIKSLIEKFSYVFNLTLLFGSALSGFLFYHFGFVGCIVIAIVSFIPMILIYIVIFDKNEKVEVLNYKKRDFGITRITEGLNILKKHDNLLYSAIATAFAYIPGAIYPGLIAFFAKYHGVTDDISSYGISAGILIGTIFIPVLTRFVNKLNYNKALFYAFIPTIASLIMALIYNENFYVFCLSFAMNCIGFSTLNMITVMLRVKSVNQRDIPMLNTAYYAIMCIGQSLGTLILFPLINSHPKESIGIMIFSFLVAALIFLFKCSDIKIGELVEGKNE